MLDKVYFTHGSPDSLDHDIYVLFDEIPSFKDAKSYCSYLTTLGYNANILVIKDGIVVWSFKGTVDECNNSLYLTYSLHEQRFPNPITKIVPSDYEAKIVRTVRGLISYFSRTDLRKDVKNALRSNDFKVKLDLLKKCSLSYDINYNKNTYIEIFKFFAFQLGQTYSLIVDNELLFTKKDVALKYPSLSPYLYRVKCVDTKDLNDFFIQFVSFLENNIVYIKTENNIPFYQYCYNKNNKRIFSFVEEKNVFS